MHVLLTQAPESSTFPRSPAQGCPTGQEEHLPPETSPSQPPPPQQYLAQESVMDFGAVGPRRRIETDAPNYTLPSGDGSALLIHQPLDKVVAADQC